MNIWKFFNLINLFKKIKEWWSGDHPDLDLVRLNGCIKMVQQKGYPPYIPIRREERCKIVKIGEDYGLLRDLKCINIKDVLEDNFALSVRLIKSGELEVFVVDSDGFSFIY